MSVFLAMVAIFVLLIALGAMLMLGEMITRGMRFICGIPNPSAARLAEQAHASLLLSHFDEIRDAVLEEEWENFHLLNGVLKELDYHVWKEFNDDLKASGEWGKIPK